jgi:hypothetical protein
LLIVVIVVKVNRVYARITEFTRSLEEWVSDGGDPN